MNLRHATTILNVIVVAIAIVGLMAIAAVDNLIGVALLTGAALLAVSQRTQLARSIHGLARHDRPARDAVTPNRLLTCDFAVALPMQCQWACPVSICSGDSERGCVP